MFSNFRIIKKEITLILLFFSSSFLHSQQIRQYETKYVIETSTSYEKQGANDGHLDGAYEERIAITHNINEETIQVYNPITKEIHWLFKNVKFDKYYTTNEYLQLKTYLGTCEGYHFFISFCDRYIKIDNRELFKSYTLVFQ